MGLIKDLKRRLFHWHTWDEWVLHDIERVHEVVEEYGSACKVDMHWARVYRHRDTGEKRVYVGPRCNGFPTTQTCHPRDRDCEWGRIGRDRVDFTSTERSLFVEETETWSGD